MNICARARRSTSRGNSVPVAGKITVSPVTSPKFLLRPRAPCRCWDVHAGAQTQPEEGQQFSGQPQPEPQGGGRYEKKVARKTKGRGRKAAQPGASAATAGGVTITGFQTISRSERLTVTTAPPRPVRGITGEMRMSEYFRILQGTA